MTENWHQPLAEITGRFKNLLACSGENAGLKLCFFLSGHSFWLLRAPNFLLRARLHMTQVALFGAQRAEEWGTAAHLLQKLRRGGGEDPPRFSGFPFGCFLLASPQTSEKWVPHAPNLKADPEFVLLERPFRRFQAGFKGTGCLLTV